MLLGEECVKNAGAGENQFSCAYLILFIFKNHLNVFEIVCVHACVFSCVCMHAAQRDSLQNSPQPENNPVMF